MNLSELTEMMIKLLLRFVSVRGSDYLKEENNDF